MEHPVFSRPPRLYYLREPADPPAASADRPPFPCHTSGDLSLPFLKRKYNFRSQELLS